MAEADSGGIIIMNSNLLAVVKQIISKNGEGILEDPQRLKAFFSDLAKDEPKPLRLAFGRCIESGAYTALKTAPDAAERSLRKTAIARQVRDEHGLDITLCGEALDILEAALFGEGSAAAEAMPEPAAKQRASGPDTSTPFSYNGTTAAAAAQYTRQSAAPRPEIPAKPAAPANPSPQIASADMEQTKGRTVFIVFVVFFLIGIVWFAISQYQNTIYQEQSTQTQEQAAPKKDANGLTPADYDSNGWAYVDGKWVASPEGAVYGRTASNSGQATVRIVNNTGFPVYFLYLVPNSAQYWGDDKLGSGTLSNGASITLPLPYSAVNRYGIMLTDSDGDSYRKWDIPISNGQTITFTMGDFYQN
jgi:hypothetical protein